MSVTERLQRIFAGAGGGLGQPPPDSPTLDTSEQIYISSLALLKMLKHDRSNSGNCKSSISGIYGLLYDGIHFAAPISSLRADELDLVRGVLQILQGLSSSFFYWDHTGRKFCAKQGIYVSHLSLSTLHAILHQFMYAATCLQLIEIAVNEVESSKGSPPPTLRAFLFFVSAWLKRLRDTALKEEVKLQNTNSPAIPSLLGLCSSLSSLCSGAEYLLHLVHEAIPRAYFEKCSSIPAAELSAHVLDILYRKLDEVCLVKGGQEEAYQMVLQTFVGSLLPYIEGLDSWLFDGTLYDPCEEMFFYANQAISVDEAEFWEKSFFFRLTQFGKLDFEFFSENKKETTQKDVVNLSNLTKEKDRGAIDSLACPLFIKDIAKSVVSAGKSLQLIRHIHVSSVTSGRPNDSLINNFERSDGSANRGQNDEGLTLSEVFCVSVAGLVGYGDHLSRYFWQDEHGPVIHPLFQPIFVKQKMQGGNADLPLTLTCSMKTWHRYMVDRLLLKGPESLKSVETGAREFHYSESEDLAVNTAKESPFIRSFCHENPVLTVCQTILKENKDAWRTLNISSGFDLSPLNDEVLRKTIFGGEASQFSAIDGTNFTFGFQYGESQYQRMKNDEKLLDTLFPFPTLLPAFQDNLHMSELLPQQKNSTLSSKILNWIQNFEPKNMPLPSVILQECLVVYVKKQVDHVGKYVLSKLMNDWRLMDELAVLRSIYLLGSGDLLHHFLTVTFNKLDKGETWVDDFELNTILQESIRNSADGMPLSAPDSLVVSLTKNTGLDGEGQPYSEKAVRTPKIHGHGFGMDELDTLKFTYKVSWPLEIIANTEAIKKYNLVMGFLLKVKRAKFVLDKARRWMWKGRGSVTNYKKRHWLLQQKLLHFVDAFHQYVMDRVYHSAWRELCEGMMAAQSLDEVIEVHEAYLLSIQRQCFVVPDKLWALIANRINTILGLALDFYFLLQTPNSGEAVSAVKARCENEVDRIEKQFDDCIALLLRVLSFKLNVGNFPHLADLVTRINYNYFYMSQSGNLKTAPISETSLAARSGKKAYVGRRK